TFYLDALGHLWAVDLGKEDYSVPGIHDVNGGRWRYYRTRAEGHNTLVINPAINPPLVAFNSGQKTPAVAPIRKFESDGDGGFTIVDLTDAYSDYGVTDAKRGVRLFAERKRAWIQDEVAQTVDGGEIWWFMHTLAANQLTVDAKDRRRAILTGSDSTGVAGAQCLVRIVAPEKASFEVMDAEYLPTSRKIDPKAAAKCLARSGYKKLTIHLTGVPAIEKTTIAVLIEPLAPGEIELETLPAVQPLSEWK
ncbi:MAG: heparinase II/III family protein, partial [Candidatus Sumerlaeota bacterium]|nr:heparinase II/III family protein [Candidatus Sumerlaeota bacterium]